MEGPDLLGELAARTVFQYPTLGSFLWKLLPDHVRQGRQGVFQYPTLGSFLWKLFGSTTGAYALWEFQYPTLGSFLWKYRAILPGDGPNTVSVSYPRIVPMEAATPETKEPFRYEFQYPTLGSFLWKAATRLTWA